MQVPFYQHNLGEEEVQAVTEVLRSVFLTTGPRTKQFEENFAQYLEMPHAVGMTSWTNAAFLVLQAWGIGPGDEVIVPAMTFIASSNIVIHCGAKPIIVDVNEVTGNIDPKAVEDAITPATKAIIPVHMYGQMADMKALRAIADQHQLKILEDCAHCIEGNRDGYRPGQLSEAAAFSFYATKNITCGEGGAVVSKDEQLIEDLRLLRLHGMSKSAADRYTALYKHWDMECLGFKANMNDLQAAMLLHQLETIEDKWQRKEEICQRYQVRFDEAGINYPKVLQGSKSARHIFTVWAPDGKRDQTLHDLQQAEIGVAVNFRAIHLLKYYRENFGFKPGDLPNAERIGDATLTIPLYPKMTNEQVEYVADKVIESIRG